MTAQDANLEDMEERVATFSKAQARDQKNQRLALTFFGVLELFNKRRAKYMRGILKYSRQQLKRAEIINDGLDKLSKLKAENAPTEKFVELENNLIWQQRMFDDRELSIRFLCEQPVDVEAALGDMARALSNELD